MTTANAFGATLTGRRLGVALDSNAPLFCPNHRSNPVETEPSVRSNREDVLSKRTETRCEPGFDSWKSSSGRCPSRQREDRSLLHTSNATKRLRNARFDAWRRRWSCCRRPPRKRDEKAVLRGDATPHDGRCSVQFDRRSLNRPNHRSESKGTEGGHLDPWNETAPDLAHRNPTQSTR